MNLLNKLLFSFLLLLLFVSSNITKAQTPLVINYSDKAKIFDYQEWYQNSYVMPLVFQDYDNKDNLWLSYIDRVNDSILVCKMDDNLNIEKKIIGNNQILNFKYNSKLYGLRFTYLDYGDHIDSVFFYCSDSIGNNKISKLIRTYSQDSILSSTNYNEVFLNKDNNIVLLNCHDSQTVANARIYIIDTLGNIVKSKSYNLLPSFYPSIGIVETNESYSLVRYFHNTYENRFSRLYKIDKNTLNITDSITFDSIFIPTHIVQVNDSIFISSRNYEKVYEPNPYHINLEIVNIKSTMVNKIRIDLQTDETYNQSYVPYFGRNFDFISEDSIYYCYISENNGTNFINIVNFSINGNINFRYRIDYDSTILYKQLNGIKATTDGGLVMAFSLYNTAWVVKFMPNGFVGLTDVETGEKASLKVYPNPAKDFVLVDIEADRFDRADIEIYDLGGRMVKRSKLSARVGNRIDVSSLKAGVYGYRVVLNGKGVNGKIVIGE